MDGRRRSLYVELNDIPCTPAVLAIDPGNERSGWLVLSDEGLPVEFGVEDNEAVLEYVREPELLGIGDPIDIAVENIQPRYGLPLGWTVINTSQFIGMLREAARPLPVTLITRTEIMDHLGVAPRGNADQGVRASLVDRYGGESAIGRKAEPGPLYGISTHVWSALSVGVTWQDNEGR